MSFTPFPSQGESDNSGEPTNEFQRIEVSEPVGDVTEAVAPLNYAPPVATSTAMQQPFSFAGQSIQSSGVQPVSAVSLPTQPVSQQREVYPQPSALPVVPARPNNASNLFQQQPAQQPAKSGGAIKSLLLFLAGGLLASLAFAVGFIVADNGDTSNSSTSSAARAPSVATVEPGETTPLVDVEGTEPAVAVAKALGQAVVQIEISSGNNFGVGSGVVFQDNLIITNNHVIEGADEVRVRQNTGQLLDAEVIGTDPRVDIAVLQVEGGSLPIAQLALGEELQVGQTAIAIGSPFLLQQTVTEGIVSALNRPVESRVANFFVPMIQTDAPINQGNSGGALADARGKVIGINTSILTDGKSATNGGIGFAIPIDVAVDVAERLLAGDPVEAGFLGVTGAPPSSGAPGVEISEVTAGSAADDAGIEVGDIVISVDDAPVTNIAELAGLVSVRQPGDTVTLRLSRNNAEQSIDVTIGGR